MKVLINVYPRGGNRLRPRQNCWRFADDIFNGIFLNKDFSASNTSPLKYVPWGAIDNAALVQIFVCWRTGDEPLSESIIFFLAYNAALGLDDLIQAFNEQEQCWKDGWTITYTQKPWVLVITHPCPNFNGGLVQRMVMSSFDEYNYIPQQTVLAITNSCHKLKWIC